MRGRLLETRKTEGKSRTSHAQVVDDLGKAIVSGAFPIGSILPGDSDLLQRFKVSRTVLRESMKTLAAKGLVVPRARVGTRVTEKIHWNMFDSAVLTWHFESGVNEEFLLHLYDIRLAFEPFAASLVAKRASPEEIESLRKLAMAMAAPEHTPDSLAVADLHFHLAITEASHNPFMRSLGGLIEAALVGMFRMSAPPTSNGFGNIADTHMAIVDAIAAGDELAAHKAMEFVIFDGRRHVQQAFAALADA
ncbi:FadR/GntR family transcriptional regulator [Rhizobium sp. LEGMi198b]|uniref:FadR/GntR family transcriptional regulator n=1 Tax=unclassified Rhizobium TaxID=2613769 RepID=UPI000CDF4E1B|nr:MULTISPECIES: FadR/GntR family transcriptional regulator [Rhizobium]AVA21531.1 GntR family transcriptional regulator protein [Rhizobium sp. NXC24]MDK4737478.1 FadR/GntR family transcriptional regulator [Rhizobium sp. CNPSo 3464]UWU22626.1 FadR family transcriptional regulator [Rhizobium tropici]WFU03414.1 FadR/GntR family transcriptional regulator [Rhizobium sp. CB3171]